MAKAIPYNKTTKTQTATPGELNLTWENKKGKVDGGLLDYELELYSREKGTLRILLMAIKGEKSHTDKLDMFRSQARNSFAHSAGKRFQLASEKIEEELEQILMMIRRLPREAFGKAQKGEGETITTYTENEKHEAIA